MRTRGVSKSLTYSERLLGALDGESNLVKDAGDMSRMVSDRKFIFNNSCDHRTRPYARGESIRHRPAVQDVGKFLLLTIGQGRWATRSMSLQRSVHSVLLPIAQPDGDLGTVNLENGCNLRGCFALHVEDHCVEPSGNAICSVPKGLSAELNEVSHFICCSMYLDRFHGTSFL